MRSDKIRVDVFVQALRWQGLAEVDAEEVECMLANQIIAGYASGYVSHEHATVVFHKTTPFPKRKLRVSS